MYVPATRTLIVALAASLAVAAAIACGGGKRPTAIDNVGGDAGEGAGGEGGTGPTWTFRTLDGGDDTGYQPELRLSPDGNLTAVWFRPTDRKGICELEGRTPAETDVWEIVYGVEYEGDFVQEIVTEIELVGRPTGLSLAFEPGGAPLVAFMGGEPSELHCGATDAVIARRGGSGWTLEVIDVDGNVPAMAFEEDVDHCANYQDACNQGGVVGLWPALGIAEGQPVLAYRDIHFGSIGVDSLEKSDLQLYWRGELITAEAVSGAGSYSRLVVDDAGGIHIAHFNEFHRISDVTQDYTDGVWVIHHEGGAWSRERVVPNLQVGEGIGLAAFADRLALAWFETKEGRLRYVERQGDEWASAEVVDNRGRTGLSPSLAFDGDGRAMISYRLCGAGQAGMDCQAKDDRLRLAVRGTKGWEISTVRNDPGKQEGLYTSLAIDASGRPAIAFQESFFDAIDQVVRRRLVLAQQGDDE